MESYEETMSSFLEVLALGYSFSSAVEMIEDDEESNETALKEIKNAQKYGI
ncbi:hypothetical protein ACFVVQ_12245 [Paenibacillus chitinolyticus]|uniref:hypothetical protein n=1 Tax=Paenibacillus chitinolyticus TaxID=79263 RepID=UPI0036DC8927